MALKKVRLDYKWIILATCFLMEFLCLGFCSSNVGYRFVIRTAYRDKEAILAQTP